ncbi:MAG: HAD family phosphatase [Candidatus Vogelbacteria bacterium]|nr:HAD family phosphatase [Candidatus Vogelbacteria bacterium]
MNDIKAVIFDMDGVIVDSEIIHVMAENYVLNKYNIYPTEAEWQSFKGKTSADIFAHIIVEHNIEGASAEDMAFEKIDKFVEMILAADVKLFSGFTDLINHLVGRYHLALVTSSHARIQKAIFGRFNLQDFFPVVVTGDMVSKGKPDPEPYSMAISKIDAPASSCAAIEDSVNGILSAKGAGANVLAVTHTFKKDRLFQADWIVDSLKEIKDIL